MIYDTSLPVAYASKIADNVREEYTIDKKLVTDQGVKRGLRNADGTGVLAGITRIGSVMGYYVEDEMRVPTEGKLYYRGIDVEDIVASNRKNSVFGYEEVAYLLLMGKLPKQQELLDFDEVLSKARVLPENFNEDIIMRAPSVNIMNKLASCVLALYSYDPNPEDNSLENMLRTSIELIGRFPVLVANSYAVMRHHYQEKSLYIHQPKENLSLAENFLRMVRPDKQYTDEEAKLLDTMLVLHAEHGGGNNSAFVCRALSSSGTDTYSAIAGALGSLKGPLHGGANAKVIEMFHYIKENVSDPADDGEMRDYLGKILDGEAGDRSAKIYGIGHAVYTRSDPRAVLIKKFAREVAEQKGIDTTDLDIMETVERVGVPLIMERKNQEIPMCANVDLYSGLVYGILGVPQELFTPLFAVSRISGWCAHRIEEVMTGGRIMRPAYRAYTKNAPYVEMCDR
ncbi:MAG TPA: citrate synthase [Oscillospiraceae bacterium]|nr:citrate synthase [Oscillospiraceae bacterium]HNW05226.1 citrate synthase [Oscillospiraceae bacterium]